MGFAGTVLSAHNVDQMKQPQDTNCGYSNPEDHSSGMTIQLVVLFRMHLQNPKMLADCGCSTKILENRRQNINVWNY
jgi:hypothetical protein